MLPTQGAQFDPWSGNQIPHATAKSLNTTTKDLNMPQPKIFRATTKSSKISKSKYWKLVTLQWRNLAASSFTEGSEFMSLIMGQVTGDLMGTLENAALPRVRQKNIY